MWTEFLKIIPSLDNKDLQKMSDSLSKRFSSVAKRFGNGLKNAVLGGGLIGVVGGLINKILNPLKETEDVLNQFLMATDDISTNAKQFETTAGNLAKLQSFGTAAGLDAPTLNTMLGKFQVALAEARQQQNDPTLQPDQKPQLTLLKDFVNEKDTAKAFFDFIQALQAVDKDTQVLAQQQVFGEKLILKQSDFLNLDFKKIADQLSGVSSEQLTTSIEKGAAIKDQVDLNQAIRDQIDLVKKAQIVNPSVTQAINDSAQKQLNRENNNLSQFENLRKAQDAADKIAIKAEEIFVSLSASLPVLISDVQKISAQIETVRASGGIIGKAIDALTNARGMRWPGGIPRGSGDPYLKK